MFLTILFVSRLFSFNLMYLVSSYKSDSLNDESDNDGYGSGSAGMFSFPFRFEKIIGCVDDSVGHVGDFVGSVCVVESGFFVPTGIESVSDFFLLFVFVPIGVKSNLVD